MLVSNNLYIWSAVVKGPVSFFLYLILIVQAGTPYEGGRFPLAFEFPAEYPFKGPTVHFKCKIHHPNVDDVGAMCIGIMKSDAWKPSTKVSAIIEAILQLLREPQPDDALSTEVGTSEREHTVLLT